MSSNERKIVVLGLKGTGKSTFLAALWQSVEAPGGSNCSLFAPSLQPDRTYLNRLRRLWLSFEEVERTSIRGGEQYLSMTLEDRASGQRIALTVPDLSGESFRLQWAERTAKREYAEHSRQADGALLFLHPLQVVSAPRTPRQEGSEDRSPTPSPPREEEIDWDSGLASTQVQAVDLLQILASLRRPGPPLPTVVVISAWDLVPRGITPDVWLAQRLPLLDQFIAARSDEFDCRVVGVSAQGGDLSEDLERLSTILEPSDRIYVISGVEVSKDITEPLAWILAHTDET